MKRIVVIFVVLILGLSVALAAKVRQNDAIHGAPSGSSGIIEGTEVAVTARLGARIEKVNVDEGDAVKAGQVLVELDCREQEAVLAAAEAGLAAAKSRSIASTSQIDAAKGSASAALAGASATKAQREALEANRKLNERTLERIRKLKASGVTTDIELDRYESQQRQLEEQALALESQMRAAQDQAGAATAQTQAARAQSDAARVAIEAAAADLARAKVAVGECQLVSPIDGYVLTRAFEPGEVVMPGSRVLTVVKLDPAETIFYLPNAELARATVGAKVTINADAYPGKTFPGTIASIAAKAEFTPRNIQTREDRDRLVYAVRVRIPNSTAELRPGMPVEVTIDGTGKSD
ncbi:efflux RND transporter periplasmic adaptor subunit [Myxococcota bacterium]|nr:efflux RND transporter periplasmic adaptor subunit [Myxococcota bacterium]